jgi:hypothetical protein
MIVKPKIFQDSGTYLVRFLYLDIEDGVLVHKNIDRYVNAGETVVAPSIDATLAATANSCALEFVEWNQTDLTNVQWNKVIGATYRNAAESGIRKTHAFIVVNSGSGLEVPLYFYKSDTSELTISWGDGSANYTTTTSGNLNTTHIYATAGKYEIKMWISSGDGTYGVGNGSNTTSFVGGASTSPYIFCLESCFIGDSYTTLLAYSFYVQRKLSIVSIPKNVTSISQNAFSSVMGLTNIIIPNSVTSIGANTFDSCRGLQNISLSSSVTTLNTSCFYFAESLSGLDIPKNVTTISSNLFVNCTNLIFVNYPSEVTSLSSGCNRACVNLRSIKYETVNNAIGSNAFSSSYTLRSFIIPETVTTINSSAFALSGIQNIIIPAAVTTINATAFENCYALSYITLKRFTAPSTITTLANVNVFNGISSALRIYVPVGSLAVYQAAANWSTYASQMYEDTPQNRALFGD